MDERTEGYGRHPDMARVARELSGLTQTAGKVGFAVTYTAIPGNVSIHEDFQRFCFERSNNEYLAGIGKLLESAKLFEKILELEERLSLLELKEMQKDGMQEKEEIRVKEIKTF